MLTGEAASEAFWGDLCTSGRALALRFNACSVELTGGFTSAALSRTPSALAQIPRPLFTHPKNVVNLGGITLHECRLLK
jgi:hypothetical protein